MGTVLGTKERPKSEVWLKHYWSATLETENRCVQNEVFPNVHKPVRLYKHINTFWQSCAAGNPKFSAIKSDETLPRQLLYPFSE
jgi:hypothetical protein